MNHKVSRQAILTYHAQGPAGKLATHPTKPLITQQDLSLAYSPGVSVPCEVIAKDKSKVYDYTAKGNLIAVVSDGTSVLGLGNIGPEAAKPVMEGKAALFKKLAGIDAFDIELATSDPEEVVKVIEALAPTFGGINLEDIKAPECFYIEDALRSKLSIPVMHDDQHGIAIIAGAALQNALTLVNKDIKSVQVVINGAGAGAIACAKLFLSLGVMQEHLVMCDTQGVIRKNRTVLSPIKALYATDRPISTLTEAIRGTDVFLGLSIGNVLTVDHIRSMAANPIVFALANPNPEISYEAAIAACPGVIMATGRSDYPNQINNLLGFPYIFRGALDVHAMMVNEAMKLAAVEALTTLAQEPTPSVVQDAYPNALLEFSRAYLLPKPLDPRLITVVSTAVAQAAIDSGIAKKPILDWEAYKATLKQRIQTD